MFIRAGFSHEGMLSDGEMKERQYISLAVFAKLHEAAPESRAIGKPIGRDKHNGDSKPTVLNTAFKKAQTGEDLSSEVDRYG